MTHSRYGANWLCLLSWVTYAANRFVLVPAHWPSFFHEHLDDLLLVPALLPPVLWVQGWLGLRADDRPPRASEVVLHTVVWSFIAEVVAPQLTARAVADPLDVVAYAVGAFGAWLVWSRG